MQGLRAGTLGEEIEARLRGVTEPSVEKLREALREEIEKLEERFNVRKGRAVPAKVHGIPPGQRPGKIPEGPRNQQRPQMGEDREAEKASMYLIGTTR